MQKNNNNEKTLARLAAIQTIYSHNIDDVQDIENTLNLTTEEIKKEQGKLKKSLTRKLVNLVIENQENLNDLISQNSDNSEKNQINTLISSILQVALSELIIDKKTDRKIIVSEFVNLTADFFNEKETGYVNAVLDRYVKS